MSNIISLPSLIDKKKQASLSGKKELSVRIRELEEMNQRLIDRLLLLEEEQKTQSERLWKTLRLLRKMKASEDDGEDA